MNRIRHDLNRLQGKIEQRILEAFRDTELEVAFDYVLDVDVKSGFSLEQTKSCIGFGSGDDCEILGIADNLPREFQFLTGEDDAEFYLLENGLVRVKFNLDYLGLVLGKHLGLPEIVPQNFERVTTRLEEIVHSHPRTLHLQRQQLSNASGNGIVTLRRKGGRHKVVRYSYRKESNATAIYVLDQFARYWGQRPGDKPEERQTPLETAKKIAFASSLWFERHYTNPDVRFVIHGNYADEANYETFFDARPSTSSSLTAAYGKCAEILSNATGQDVFIFQFSQGNYSYSEIRSGLQVLKVLLPSCRLFAYVNLGQDTKGSFKRVIDGKFGNNSNFRSAQAMGNKDIYEALKKMFS